MKRKLILLLCMFVFLVSAGHAQKQDSTYRKHFISSSFFIFYNLAHSDESPSYFQLNYGYRINPKNVILVEAITWKYYAPLGIPYGPYYDDKKENFPGYVQSFGIGVAYQRFIWKGLFATLNVTPFIQHYFTPEKEKIQTGFQLFTALRVGYHIPMFKNRFFIEPSIACTYWPINTNMPGSFAEQENKWPHYFLFEPGFNFGVKF